MLKRSGLLSALATLALGFATQPGAAQSNEIIVGAPNAMTGIFGEAGQRVVAGLDIAIKQINTEGGIKTLNGARLKMIAADTGGDDPTQAASITRRMIAEDKAVILMGASTSAMTLAAQIEAEKAEVPIITSSYVDQIVLRGLKYTFKISPQGSVSGALQLKYMKDMIADARGTAPKSIAVFVGSDPASQSILKSVPDLAKTENLDIKATVTFQSGLSDPTPIVSAALRTKPDFIILNSGTADLILIVKALRAVNVNVPISSAGGIDTDLTGTSLGKVGDGLCGVVAWVSDMKVPGNEKVLELYKQYYPNNTFPPAHEFLGLGYSIGMIMRAAFEKAASTDPKRLRDTLANIEVDVPLAGGKAAFDEKGLNKLVQPVMAAWLDGRLRTVWPKTFQTTDLTFLK